MIVYGSSLAPAVRKVLTFLREKGLAAAHCPLAPHDDLPEFVATSPLGRIPGFRDGDFKLSDSTAICHYLERKYPLPPLFPAAAEDYGRMVWLDQFAETALGAAECKVVTNLIVRPQRNEAPDLDIVERALTLELPPLYDYLERQIDGPFLLGGRLSLADLAIAAPLSNLGLTSHPPDPARWPRLVKYHAGIAARQAFAAIRD